MEKRECGIIDKKAIIVISSNVILTGHVKLSAS
jgi:hypothetical protein